MNLISQNSNLYPQYPSLLEEYNNIKKNNTSLE